MFIPSTAATILSLRRKGLSHLGGGRHSWTELHENEHIERSVVGGGGRTSPFAPCPLCCIAGGRRTLQAPSRVGLNLIVLHPAPAGRLDEPWVCCYRAFELHTVGHALSPTPTCQHCYEAVCGPGGASGRPLACGGLLPACARREGRASKPWAGSALGFAAICCHEALRHTGA
jgi:hypothetical protein